MIRLRGDGRSAPHPETLGMRKMREILDARCRYAGVELKDLFDAPETCAHLCEMTGGHPRHLMMFLQAAASCVDDLPITRKAVDRAIRSYANSLLRSVPDEFWEPLRKFETPQTSIPTDAIHQEMLLLLFIFEYMNGESWYELSPAIRTLPKLREEAACQYDPPAALST